MILSVFAKMGDFTKCGKEYGQYKNTRKFEAPLDVPQFDGETIKQKIQNNDQPHNEITKFIKTETSKNTYDIRDDESFITKAAQYLKNPHGELKIETDTEQQNETIHTCIESLPYVIKSFVRTLDLKFKHVPGRKVKRCNAGNHPIDDDPTCTSYDIISYPDKWDYQGDEWIIDNLDLFNKVQNNTCNILNVECLVGPERRCIHEQSFRRSCWKERVFVECQSKEQNGCRVFRERGCQEIKQKCLEYDCDMNCVVYEKTYKCSASHEKRILKGGLSGIHCIDGGSLVSKSTPNIDMAEVMSKLSVLSEMQKELKNQMSINNLFVFSGECLSCTKNALGNALYDCCAVRGLATNVGFAHCSAQEKKLAQMRMHNKCVEIGSKANRFLGVRTSTTFVYCCFGSKLIKAMQIEARKQLGVGWGDAGKPNCRGLTVEEIERINFEKLDLSEIYDDIYKNLKPPEQKIDEKETQKRIEKQIRKLQGRVKK